ncbi:hypothetical protein D3C74_411740 [compost metagenome]
MVLIRFIRPVINHLIEGKVVPAVKGGIAVFIFLENIFKHQFRHLADDFRHFHIQMVNFLIDFLLFIRQKYENFTVLLNESLAGQNFQRFLYLRL